MVERRDGLMELSLMTVLAPTDSAGTFRYVRSRYDANAVSPVGQRTPTEMIGRTVSRKHVFLNRFTNLGFIEYHGGLEVHRSLLRVTRQQ
jgi:hypothetical protein